MPKATGTFDVTITPVTDPTAVPGRMTIDKTFAGELSGKSDGEMLTAMTAVQGSAGYVAVEKVTGTLAGKSGSFILLHHGVMSAVGEAQHIVVVPDSGTDALAGLSGSMRIINDAGAHSYEFDYEI